MPASTGGSETREEEQADGTAFEPGRLRDHVHALTLEAEVALLERERTALEVEIAALESEVEALEEEVEGLETALARKDRHLQGVIDRYERIIAERDRERRSDSAPPDRSTGSPSTRATVRTLVGRIVSRLR